MIITQLTPEIKEEIKKEIRQVLDKGISYENFQELYDHTCQVAELTKGKSGFFGVRFPSLLVVLEEMKEEFTL